MATSLATKRDVTRTLVTTKRVLNGARDLVRALRVLEDSLEYDYFGRIVTGPDEPVDEVLRELRDLLRLVRNDYPASLVEINVMVRVSDGEVPADGMKTERKA